MTDRRSVIVDASSAILLHKARLFFTLAKTYGLVMSGSVFREITVEGRPGCSDFLSCREDGRIRVIVRESLGQVPVEAQLMTFGAGEMESILLYRASRGEFLIVDDRKAAGFCRENRIPYINALLVPRILCFAGILPREDSELSVSEILSLGRYSAAVTDFARNRTREDLSFFLP